MSVKEGNKVKGRTRTLSVAVVLAIVSIVVLSLENAMGVLVVEDQTALNEVLFDTTSTNTTTIQEGFVDHNPSLTFVTLTYGSGPKSSEALDIILHNCLMIKQAKGNHEFIVYTDRPEDKEYCNHCHCEKFVLYNCKCPVANCTGTKNACEKNHFFSDFMIKYPEFVYLDHDLAIIKPSFFDAFYARTRQHDFLAARTQGPGQMTDYKKTFNSGLVFIRRIPTADPMLLRDYMYTKNKENFDQTTLSIFVQEKYDNWDELSLKWHCRRLRDTHKDIPLDHCYTLHPPFKVFLKKLNYTLLKP